MTLQWPSAAASRRRTRRVVTPLCAREVAVNGTRYVNFASNNYLGVAHHPEVVRAYVEALQSSGASSSSAALITGFQPAHDYLTRQLCEWWQREDLLLFNTGFAANSGVLRTLAPHYHRLWLDRLAHASLLDGVQTQRASSETGRWRRFAHNDLDQLARFLTSSATAPAAATQHQLVITESIFSMDGDEAPLASLVALLASASSADRAVDLWVDDAHAVGVYGESGAGCAGSFSQAQVPYLTATFGKAIGVAGACFAASNDCIEYVLNHAREYIYSTAMPAAQAAAVSRAVTLIQSAWGASQRQRLVQNIAQFRAFANQLPWPLLPSDSAIQGVLCGSDAAALACAKALQAQGIWAVAIRPPTVPKGTARVRLTLSAAHTEADLRKLQQALMRAAQNQLSAPATEAS